jgi:hypothetical protein
MMRKRIHVCVTSEECAGLVHLRSASEIIDRDYSLLLVGPGIGHRREVDEH